MVRSHLRRLPAAAAIAVVATLGLGAAFAATSTPAPQRFDVAPALLGDKGAYTMRLEGDWGMGSPDLDNPEAAKPFTALRFAWVRAETQDAHGRVGAADVLRVQSTAWDLNIFSDEQPWTLRHVNQSWAYRDGDATPFRFDTEGEREGFTDPTTVAGIVLPLDRFGSRSRIVSSSFVDLKPDCWIANPWRGTALPESGKAPGAVCASPVAQGLLAPPPLTIYPFQDTSWTVAGRETLDGRTTLRLERADVAVWLAPGLPVPYRIELDASTSESARRATLSLTSFERGTVELGRPAVWSAPRVAPPVHPVQEHGIDETGVDATFPAAAAWSFAKEQPAVRDVLRRLPGAAVIGQQRWTVEMYGHLNRSWEWRLSDGASVAVVEAWQALPAALDGLAGPVRDAFVSQGAAAVILDEDHYGADPVPPGAVGPTIGAADLMGLWRAQGGAGEPDTWGFGIVPSFGADGIAYRTVAFAGRLGVQHVLLDPARVTSANSLRADYDLLLGASDGSLAGRTSMTWDTDAGWSPQLETTSAPPAAADRATPGLPWSTTPMQAAGATLLGLVLAVLYWAWPWIQSGPLALFSRVHGPAAAEHPARRRILDAVAARPGIHAGELGRVTGLANGALVHHTGKLAQAGLLQTRTVGRYMCHFPAGASTAGAGVADRAPGARAVLEALQASPGEPQPLQAIAAAARLAPSTAHYHLQRLVAEQRVVRAEGDGAVRFAAA